MTKTKFTDYFVETSLGHPSGGMYFQHGDRVPAGLFSDEQLQRLARKGYVVLVPGGEQAAPPAPTDPAKPPIQSNQARDLSRWAYPDEMLEGRDLKILNAMVFDHARLYQLPEVEPFETIEEARAFLQHQMAE